MIHSTPYHSRKVLFTAIAAAMFFLAVTSRLRADEYEQFSNAKNAFDGGEYEEAVHRFEELLGSTVQNPALVLEAYKLLGISYLFMGNKEAAEKNFTELLTKAPDFELDPVLYPIEVIDVFTGIKQKNEKRLEELAGARAIEEEKRAAEAKRRQKEETARLTRNIYVERTRKERSFLVALMPLGAGQFQNGEKGKGILFMSSQLFFGAVAITSYFLHAGLRSRSETPFDDSAMRRSYEIRERVYRLSNHISLGLLGAAVVYGIADSLYHFRRAEISWKKVDEKEVPLDLRPRLHARRSLTLTLQLDDGWLVAGLRGHF